MGLAVFGGPFIGGVHAAVTEAGLRICDETHGQAVRQDGQDIIGLEPSDTLDLRGRVGSVDTRPTWFSGRHGASDAGVNRGQCAKLARIRKLSSHYV